MRDIQEMEEFALGLGIKIAVVQVKPGESTAAAWARHLTENPADAEALIKIFNQSESPGSLADSA